MNETEKDPAMILEDAMTEVKKETENIADNQLREEAAGLMAFLIYTKNITQEDITKEYEIEEYLVGSEDGIISKDLLYGLLEELHTTIRGNIDAIPNIATIALIMKSLEHHLPGSINRAFEVYENNVTVKYASEFEEHKKLLTEMDKDLLLDELFTLLTGLNNKNTLNVFMGLISTSMMKEGNENMSEEDTIASNKDTIKFDNVLTELLKVNEDDLGKTIKDVLLTVGAKL